MLEKLADKRSWLVLAAILLLGLFLRTYCLTCESLWLDEGFSVEWASKDPAGIITSASSDVHTPFYFLLLHYWMGLFGSSEAAIRSLSLIFSFLSILIIYRIGESLFDKKIGLLSSLFMALSTFHIYFAQEARPYALVIFLTLLSMLYFQRHLESNSKRDTLLYIILTSLMFYTHIFGLFIILAQNMFVFSIRTRKPIRELLKWIKVQTILFIVILPWFLIILFRLSDLIGNQSVIGWLPAPSLLYILGTFGEYFGYYYVYPWEGLSTSLPNIISIISAIVAFIVLCLVANSLIEIRDKRIILPEKNRKKLYMLVLWLFVPILVPLIISLTIKPIFWPRFTIIASPAFYILASVGINKINRKHVRIILIAVIISMSMVNAYRLHTDINKEQWREAAGIIQEMSLDNDILVYYQFFTINGPIDYYLDTSKYAEIGISDNNFNQTDFSSIASHTNIWLIFSHIMERTGTEQAIIETVNKTHHHELSEYLEGVDVHLYRRR